MYKDADIYLMDDPLSAVDTKVGKHLFHKLVHLYLQKYQSSNLFFAIHTCIIYVFRCICGSLRNKTRLLITHQLQYLKHVDRIIILDGVSILFK